MLSATIIRRPRRRFSNLQGGCGSHTYTNVSQQTIDAIMKALRDQGADISGSNPWNVITHNHGVVLRGTWDGVGTLTVEVTDSDFIVPCQSVWGTIDPLLKLIVQTQAQVQQQVQAQAPALPLAPGDVETIDLFISPNAATASTTPSTDQTTTAQTTTSTTDQGLTSDFSLAAKIGLITLAVGGLSVGIWIAGYATRRIATRPGSLGIRQKQSR